MMDFLTVILGACALSIWATAVDNVLTYLWDFCFWLQRDLERDAEDRRLGRLPLPELWTSAAVPSFVVVEEPEPCPVCHQPDCCASQHGDNRGTLEAKEAIARRENGGRDSSAYLAALVQAELDRVPTPAEVDAAIANAQAWLDRRDWGDGEP